MKVWVQTACEPGLTSKPSASCFTDPPAAAAAAAAAASALDDDDCAYNAAAAAAPAAAAVEDGPDALARLVLWRGQQTVAT